jgi:hypothetical protein
MAKYEIIINEDKKCKRCSKGGATQGGFCLSCVLKNLDEGKYDHVLGKHREKYGHSN